MTADEGLLSLPARHARPVPDASAPAALPVELCVVVPTFNERANVAVVAERLARCLDGIAYEIVFVDDDSPDRTAEEIRRLARQDPRIRCLQRLRRRGLSSACIEGMLASSAPFLAVMDADLQHDERLLRDMLHVMRRGDADIVIGSRYLDTTEVPGWGAGRHAMSRVSTRLAQRLLRVPVRDPMSGFFMIARDAFQARMRRLSGTGFKILLDILTSSPEPLRTVELPYRFRSRRAGESKLDRRATQDFLLLLLDKTIGRWAPPRFILFGFVGGLGIVVHLAVLATLLHGYALSFVPAQAAATLAAMTFNFALNNDFTYRERRRRGWSWLRGWCSFALACSIGAVANVGVAAHLFAQGASWLLSALGGIVVGAVWNYAVTSFYTWNRRHHG